MKQAFHVLQLPMLELSEWLKSEIENNPVLEVDLSRESFKESLDSPVKDRYAMRNKSQEDFEKRRKEHQENMLTAQVSLYEHMMNQAPLIFEQRGELNLAQLIIGHLNEKGFLETPLVEIAPSVPLEKLEGILEKIQSFDPPGIGARNLQECLLLQLKLKQKESSLAYRVISLHFDDLLHNRLPHISQKLNIPLGELVQIVEKEIAPLDLNPGYKYSPQTTAAIIPDLVFLCLEERWQIEVNTSFLPKFQIAPIYLQALKDHSLENEEYYYLRRQLAGGRWLSRIVQRRNHTLRSIGEFLLKKQKAFFNGDKGGLVPLTLKDAADELGLHESTIARAVAGKYAASPMGMYALKSFFKQGIETKSGAKISNHSLREILAKAIGEEDKLQPMSDEQLARHFSKLGIPCARRTIAKYRSSLKIAPACKRRKWIKS
ncbi:MAG: RNA polymerase factor sigma-54 [Verrucomicrobia bacterium]|nr:RNA polymerase factor sigma-54 [Verrucomicrobiota bacterium]